MSPLGYFGVGMIVAALLMLFGAGLIVWVYEAAGILPKSAPEERAPDGGPLWCKHGKHYTDECADCELLVMESMR